MPLVPVCFVATLCGLLLAPYYQFEGALLWAILALSAALCWLLRRQPLLVAVSLYCCFFSLAQLHYPSQFPSNPVVESASLSGQKYLLSGQVRSVRARSEGRYQIDILVTSLNRKGTPVEMGPGFLLRLYLGEGPLAILPGDRLQCTSRIRQPRLFGTPGEFHWPRYLASQGIAATGWVKSAESLIVKPADKFLFARTIARLKSFWAQQISAQLDEEQSLLVRALLLGEASVLPAQLRKELAAAGISHLFAISGLHLGLLGLIAYQVMLVGYRRSARLLYWQPPQRILPLLVLPILFFYLLLTGDAVATRRAFVLAVVAGLLLLWRRRVDAKILLVSLAWIFLLGNPLLLWQPSWQLSFAGVAGILLWQPAWQKRSALPLGLQRPLTILLVSAAASLATLPLILLNFHLFSPAGLLANLLCVPLVAFLALPTGLFGLLANLVFTPLGDAAFWACAQVLQVSAAAASWLTALPGFAPQYQ